MQSLISSFMLVLVSSIAGAAYAANSISVVVDKNCLGSRIRTFSAQHKISLPTQYEAIRVQEDSSLEQLINQWKLVPCVIAASPEAQVQAASAAAATNDPLLSLQLALPAIRQHEGSNYFFHPLWGIREKVVTAIIDTGVQQTHPDLSSRMWRGPQSEFGFNILTGTSAATDDNGHGTHVAGILGAQRGNAIGVQGVMGEQIQMMAVKTLDQDGGGTITDLVNGILWAADHGAEVINLSLATQGANTSLQTALEYALSKNIILVTAAGNQGVQISNANFVVPAAYSPNYEGLISVGAVDAISFLRPNYSNFGNTFVEIGAPGSEGSEGLLSTYITSTYKRERGTSMSAPHVAGAASLIVSFLKTHGFPVNNGAVETLLEQTGKNIPDLNSSFKGGKTLDLERLGRTLFYSTVIDSSGGFDEP